MAKRTLIDSNKLLTKFHWKKTQNQLISELIFNFEKTSLRTEFYSENILYGKEGSTHLTELEKIKKTTIKDILNISEEIRNEVMHKVKKMGQEVMVLPGQGHSSWEFDVSQKVYQEGLRILKDSFN